MSDTITAADPAHRCECSHALDEHWSHGANECRLCACLRYAGSLPPPRPLLGFRVSSDLASAWAEPDNPYTYGVDILTPEESDRIRARFDTEEEG